MLESTGRRWSGRNAVVGDLVELTTTRYAGRRGRIPVAGPLPAGADAFGSRVFPPLFWVTAQGAADPRSDSQLGVNGDVPHTQLTSIR